MGYSYFYKNSIFMFIFFFNGKTLKIKWNEFQFKDY